jgi:hypothetical protein
VHEHGSQGAIVDEDEFRHTVSFGELLRLTPESIPMWKGCESLTLGA